MIYSMKMHFGSCSFTAALVASVRYLQSLK